jgi:hypothetical protein
MDETLYANSTDAQTAITAALSQDISTGQVVAQSAELKSIELARLGYAIVQYSAGNTGQIVSLTVNKVGGFAQY